MTPDELVLPVSFRGEDLEFPLRVVPAGFVHRFVVVVNDTELVYERDESGDLRALLAHPDAGAGTLPDAGLVAAIGETLTGLLR